MDKEVQRLKEALASTDVRSTTYDELLDKLARIVDIRRNIMWYERDRDCEKTTTVEPVNYVEKRAESVADILGNPVVEPAPPLVEVPENEHITKEQLRVLIIDTKAKVEKSVVDAILAPYKPEDGGRFSLKSLPADKYDELAEALRNAQ